MRIPQETRYQVRVIGDGPELEHLRKRCKEDLNLSEHVHCMGSIPYMEMEKEYAGANVFIMPSIRETTGTVLLEAMSKGIPVITINKFGGATLFDKDTGWLYEGNSKEEYVENAERVLTDKNADLDDFGRMLDHTWRLKRQTGSAVSTNSIDDLYAKGVAAGALGGKLLGAGGGGFLVFYVQPERQDAVRWAMRDLMHIPFAFEDGGTRVIHYTPETYIPKE